MSDTSVVISCMTFLFSVTGLLAGMGIITGNTFELPDGPSAETATTTQSNKFLCVLGIGILAVFDAACQATTQTVLKIAATVDALVTLVTTFFLFLFQGLTLQLPISRLFQVMIYWGPMGVMAWIGLKNIRGVGT